MNAQHLAHYIDHTALTAEKTETDILTLCDEAIEYQFFSVSFCIYIYFTQFLEIHISKYLKRNTTLSAFSMYLLTKTIMTPHITKTKWGQAQRVLHSS